VYVVDGVGDVFAVSPGSDPVVILLDLARRPGILAELSPEGRMSARWGIGAVLVDRTRRCVEVDSGSGFSMSSAFALDAWGRAIGFAWLQEQSSGRHVTSWRLPGLLEPLLRSAGRGLTVYATGEPSTRNESG
jgi:hypothetical protein